MIDNLIDAENQQTQLESEIDVTNKANLTSNVEQPNESEEIARNISYKVVDYLKSNRLNLNKQIGEIKPLEAEHFKDSINPENNKDIENKDFSNENSMDITIASVVKYEHFYKEDNSLDNTQMQKSKKLRKKKGKLNLKFKTGLNSIKYRLKKNYFENKDR